ncbi:MULTISPECIES: hypothetical protein [unclassified Streptomyces]|uniref:hypothetical protein n=1 Tax=unclassified Streptomyces TaxID=2593676 RepID=UPI0022504B78|nr:MULTISPECIES: hypothetical protein [unclassified Streptomyces]MCX4650246.1 hypothetical protein [Streptomyces sp. NBC_01446]MCX5327757.1 hypothetical protein [Streptomyces sp. NBC_00120]
MTTPAPASSDWTQSRLAVIVEGQTAHPLTPVDSFAPQFNLGGEVIHSLEATHVGYVAHPANFTFTMTVKAIGGASASLTQLAMRGQEFSIGLYEAKGSTGQWDFKSILFNKCLITSANPSNAVPNAAPTATFSGVAREAVVDDGIERTLPTPIT